MQPILVTCAIIERAGRFLLTQRPEGKLNGSRWEFPGGKVEYGEDPRACLEREIREEIGIVVRAKEPLDCSSHVYPDTGFHVVLLAIRCDFVSGEIQHEEIAAHEWVTPEEMGRYDITEADRPFIERLRGS